MQKLQWLGALLRRYCAAALSRLAYQAELHQRSHAVVQADLLRDLAVFDTKHGRSGGEDVHHVHRAEAAAGVRKAKRLLYAYRVALTGIHLLLKGELVTDVVELQEEYGFPAVLELVGVKRSRETGTIAEPDELRYLEDLGRLERAFEEARTRSLLPEEPPNRDEIEKLVIELRLLL